MSKEETPITAREFYRKRIPTASVYVVMEQFAQYREKKAVQEALEAEVPKAHTEGQAFLIKKDNLKHGRYPIASEGYYQTQVKPKYE